MVRPISKELFVNCIKGMERAYRFQEDLNKVFSSNGADGYYWWDDCSGLVLKLLTEVFKFHPDVDFIEQYCYKFDFGRKVTDKSFKDKDGQYLDLTTCEKLYNYLCEGE